MQLAQRIGVPYREGFVKNRYIGRTFIMPGQATRARSVRQKLNTVAQEFKGKRVLLVDDSIVRGTTSREIVEMARAAGALKVYFASASPPVRYPNVYGIDMPTRGELIATGRTGEEIGREIGADAWSIRISTHSRRRFGTSNRLCATSIPRASTAPTSPAMSARVSDGHRNWPAKATARRARKSAGRRGSCS
jgi:glutamine phosphoribosylpyrophosphate amidotransferase